MKLRSIKANLQDPKNPALRRKVLVGDIKPEALVRMESADMASEVRSPCVHSFADLPLGRSVDVGDMMAWCGTPHAR